MDNKYYEYNSFLTHYWPIFPFYAPWIHPKSKGFLVFSGRGGVKKGTLARKGLSFTCFFFIKLKWFFYNSYMSNTLVELSIFIWKSSARVFLCCLISSLEGGITELVEIKIDSLLWFLTQYTHVVIELVLIIYITSWKSYWRLVNVQFMLYVDREILCYYWSISSHSSLLLKNLKF